MNQIDRFPGKKDKKVSSLFDKLKRAEPRYLISFLLSLLIFASTITFLLVDNYKASESPHQARGGVLDLSQLDFKSDKPVKLDGEWQFFPGELLEPGQDSYPEGRLIQVPGRWDLSDDGSGQVQGYGSYRLRVKLGQEEVYAIKTTTIRAAARVFMNGREVASLGQVARDVDHFFPESKYCTGTMVSQDQEIDIIIHVSSFYYSQGGIINSIYLGSPGGVNKMTCRGRLFEQFMAGSFLMIGALFLFIYARRSHARAILYFSCACFFMSLYLSTMDNQVLGLLISYNFVGRLAIQMVGMMGASFCFLLFAQHFFDRLVRPLVVRIIKGLIIFSGIFAVIVVLNIRLLPVELLQLFSVVSSAATYGYLTYILLKAMKQRYEAVEYILVVAASVVSYWTSMFAKMLFEFKLGYYSEAILLFVLFSTVMLVANRLNNEYVQATVLTEERLEKEFKYFFSQISPHFLYNTINTIISLSYEDSGKSRDALRNLALYFRGKLDLHLHKGLITLENDIDMANAYLEIEKLRYGDKLNLVLEIEEDLKARIPPLTLQPLAENAVRHGIVPKDGPGTLKILARKMGGQVEIVVSDDGVGMTAEKLASIREGDTGRMGMQNIFNKIHLIEGARVDFISHPGQGTTIRIYLPGGKEDDLESHNR